MNKEKLGTYFVNPKLNNNCLVCWNEKRRKDLNGKGNYFIDKADTENLKRICKKHFKTIRIVDYKNDKPNASGEIEHIVPQTANGTTYNPDPPPVVTIIS